jgi:undecaprenyl pyrophosphate phosphatase UppP
MFGLRGSWMSYVTGLMFRDPIEAMFDSTMAAGFCLLVTVAFLLGAVISFVVDMLCLRWLIRLLVADRLHWFVFCCLIVVSLTIAWHPVLLVG